MIGEKIFRFLIHILVGLKKLMLIIQILIIYFIAHEMKVYITAQMQEKTGIILMDFMM